MNKTRMGKRVASLLLSLVMMLSLLPTAAYATMADDVDTQGASVSENGTGVSDDDNSGGDTGDQQVVGGSANGGTADDTTGAEGDADTTGAEGGNDTTGAENGTVTYVAYIGETGYETLDAAITDARDGDTVEVAEGSYTLNGSLTYTGKAIAVKAANGANVIFDMSSAVTLSGAKITFENVTFNYTNADYIGLQHTDTVVYNNCTINGKMFLYANSETFNDCHFVQTSEDYNVWTYGAKKVAFNNCTFDCVGKAVNVYIEKGNASDDAKTVEVNGCTVTSTKENKAFLNIKNSTQAYDVTLSGTNTVTGLAADSTTGSALYQVETTKVTETAGNPVTVKEAQTDGTVKTVYEVKETVEASVAEVNGAKYDSLQAAVDAAKSGATVTLLADTRENVTVSKNAIVLDLNGHTLNGGTENAKPALTVDNKKVTLKDSSEAQTGTIKREDTADTKTSHYVIDIQGKNGFMIVESGKVENNSGIPGVKGSSLIRLGNDSVSGWPTLTIKGGTFTQDNFIAIKVDRGTLHLLGGTVNSANSFAIENWNNAYIKGGTVNGTVSTWVYSTGAAFSKLEISGGTVNGNVASVNYDNAADKQARVYVTGGTVTGTLGTYTYNNGLVAMDETAKATIEVTGGTFSKDPTQYVVEDSAISKNDDGTYGVAKTYLAKIGDTEYYTMDEAFHAVKAGETIVMLRDYTTNKVQNSGDESFTIDLGGHTWTANIVDTASAAFEINYSDVTLTVKNGKVVSSQLAGLIPSAMSGTITYDNSGLVFENVEMTANGHSGIETNGSNTNDTVTLRNSTLNVPNGYGIYFPSSGKLTIDNSKINAKTMGVQVCAGSLNISGAGTAITVSGDGIAKTENDGAIEDGAAISIVQRTGYKDLSKIEVEDGKFTANGTNAAVKAYKWESQTESAFDNSKNVVAVSGGTFSSAVDKSLCADGFIPTQNTDGTYGVKEGKYVAEVGSTKYKTLQAAIDAAGRKATVTMLADTSENVTISTSYLTLDLNGHTLNGGTVKGKPALTVTARVTVKDSSEEHTGTIMREDTAANSGVSSHYVIDVQGAGWLTFESGNVKNNSGNDSGKGASLVRVGDDSIAKYPGLNIKGGTFTQDNFIVIKVDSGDLFLNGGTLNSANSYAVENWHRAAIKGGTVNGTVAAWTYSGGHNSTLTISGGTVNGNVASVSYDKAEGKVAKVSITGGTVNGMLGTYTYGNGLILIEDPAKATIAVTGGTFSKDPSKYVVENSGVTPNGDGTFGVAKAYLAKVGDTSYYTMDEAFKAQTASGEAIVLLRDYTTGSAFPSGSIDRTVDLNGHTWTCTGTDANSAAFEINYSDVTLTVKNGKVVSSQLVGLIPSAMGGTIKYDNSSLVFDGVEMTTTARSGIETNGNNTNDTVTLRNSTLNVPNGFGIYFPSSGTLTIDNSVINAKTMGVQVCSGSLNITGAKTAITVTGDGIPKTINDGAIEDGAAISIVNRTGYKGLIAIKVEGGTFKANGTNAAVKAYDWDNTNKTESDFTQAAKVSVSGGTFSSEVDKSLCAKGYIPTKNADGTYGVKEGKYVAEIGSQGYESLTEAIDAAQDGQTVRLLADVEQNTQLTINKSITLDLNGKTIRNTEDIWGDTANAILSITSGAKVTITGNGIMDAKENDCYTINVAKGDLTIENGTFYGNVSVVQVEEGTLSVKGGTFDLHQKWEGSSKYLFNCIDSEFTSGNATVAISGGTFVGFDPNVSPEQKVDGKTPSFAAPGVGITKNENGSFTAVDGMTAQILDKDGNSVKAYRTLADAVAAAQDGQTVRLLADVTESNIKVNANITIDLNKMTVTGSFVTYGEVTIQNGTIDVPDGKTNYAYGKLTLVDVDITGKAVNSSLLSVNYNGSVTIDKDSTIVADSAKGDYPAVFIKGQDDSGKTYAPELNIYGTVQSAKTPAIQGNGTDRGVSHVNVFEGAVVKSESLAVYLPQPCEVNITGGLVEGYCGIGIKSGTLNISGGTVRGVANDNVIGDQYSQTNGISYDGSAIMIDSYIGYAGQVQINISGNAVVESKYSTAIREIGNDKSQTNLVGLDITGGTVLGAKDTDAVLVRDVTAKDVNISGGEFSSIVKKEYCAPGFTPVTTANSEGRYGVAVGKFTVMVTSRTTGSDSPVANVAGGGSNITYAQGTKVTASAISGYKFVGWFVNEYTGTPYSTELTCEVKPTADCTMIAVYEPISGGVFALEVSASKFTVNGGATQRSYLLEKMPVGTQVTVVFKGSENFLYWVNESGKVVSTSKTYTFSMGSATTLKAVYAEKEEHQAMVVFISHTQQVISSKGYTDTQEIQFPEPPIKMGATFVRWSMTEAEIRAAMATTTTGIIVVEPVYEFSAGSYTVTVNYPNDDTATYTATVGKITTVTAKSIDGKVFKCWKNGDTVLGYTETLKVAPRGDLTLTAEYVDAGTTVDRLPVIALTEISASQQGAKYAVSFTATRSVPDGYTVTEQGILVSTNSQYGEADALDAMKLDANGAKPDDTFILKATNTDATGVTVLNGTVSAADRTVYGRAYMILRDSSGAMVYVYSDTILSGSYNSLTTNGGN